MKRLTEILENGVINVKYASQHEAAIHRLVTIEDILGDEYDLDRLRELLEACKGLEPSEIIELKARMEGLEK